jgi:hypothetical protein
MGWIVAIWVEVFEIGVIPLFKHQWSYYALSLISFLSFFSSVFYLFFHRGPFAFVSRKLLFIQMMSKCYFSHTGHFLDKVLLQDKVRWLTLWTHRPMSCNVLSPYVADLCFLEIWGLIRFPEEIYMLIICMIIYKVDIHLGVAIFRVRDFLEIFRQQSCTLN